MKLDWWIPKQHMELCSVYTIIYLANLSQQTKKRQEALTVYYVFYTCDFLVCRATGICSSSTTPIKQEEEKYYFLKKIKVVLFCTNFFGPPEWKLPLILHRVRSTSAKKLLFSLGRPKKMRAKCYFYFWKMIFSFTQHAFSYWFLDLFLTILNFP